MNTTQHAVVALALACAPCLSAQQDPATRESAFAAASGSVREQLQQSLGELDKVRSDIAAEKLPLDRELNDLERELTKLRQEYGEKSRLLDTRTLDLSNLRSEAKSREDEKNYLSNLLGEYIRNFESRLHIAELQRYQEKLKVARLAAENSNLEAQEVFGYQAAVVSAALQRLLDAVGGDRFEGTAVDSAGLVQRGTFVTLGPAVLFRSADDQVVGTAEQRLGSLEPAVVDYEGPEDRAAAARLVTTAAGDFPLDPTLGNAHKVEAVHESFIDHAKKGGPVMVPIFLLAGLALLVALYKWLRLSFVRSPSDAGVQALLGAVARGDKQAALDEAAALPGPGGEMLAAGVEHLEEPRELVEEVMYENVLSTRLSLQRLLPFIAITASSAPLLGLLGTVTGIMKTFSLMTVFGTGDVKTLSSGISEALITTEFGLYVAIPSLLLHAFLSRKARAVIDRMEKAAVALTNQIGKTPLRRDEMEEARSAEPPRTPPQDNGRGGLSSEQVKEALASLLAPVISRQQGSASQAKVS